MCYIFQVFQKKDLALAIVYPALKGAQDKMKALLENSGPTPHIDEVKAVQDGAKIYKGIKLVNTPNLVQSYQNAYRDFLTNIIHQLERRFPQTAIDSLKALSVLGLHGIKYIKEEDIAEFGNVEIEFLVEKYGGGNCPYIDKEATLQEWAMVKTLISTQHYPTESTSILWNIIQTHHADMFPNLLALASIAAVFPVHTADVERGFSAQNSLKTKLRNRLSSERLNIIATIKLEGPHWKEFNYISGLKEFRSVKERRAF